MKSTRLLSKAAKYLRLKKEIKQLKHLFYSEVEVSLMYGFLVLALAISVTLNIILTISLVIANKKNKDSEDLIRRLRKSILIKSH